jgi:hypothetical protein
MRIVLLNKIIRSNKRMEFKKNSLLFSQKNENFMVKTIKKLYKMELPAGHAIRSGKLFIFSYGSYN